MKILETLRIRPWALSLLVSIFICVSQYAPADATLLIDQMYFDPPPGTFGGGSRLDETFRRVQTFTVGVAGPLNSVDVRGVAGTGLRILDTAAGVPTTTVLASTTLRLSPPDGWIGWDLSSSGLMVTPGEILGIEILGGQLDGQTPGKYAGGADYFLNIPVAPNFRLDANTDYFFHPEEILADNFMLMVNDKKDAPSPKVIEDLRKVIIDAQGR